MSGLIKISPTVLNTGSSVTAKNGGTSDDLTNTLMTNFNTFLGHLSPLAGEAIIGTGATALMGALDQAGIGIEGALGCFGTGLKIMAPAMTRDAQSFMSLDNSLASTFKELESLLPQVENYATPVKLITPTPAQLATLKTYVDGAKQGHLPQITATTVPIKIEAPHKGGFMGWLHDNQWAAWTAVGVITVAGVGLTVFTAGGSDAVAVGADATILGTDAAVTVAADATVATADVTLVTVGGAEVFTTAASDAAITAYSQEGLAELEAFLQNSSLVGAGG